jgi:cytochrome c-type biogenesis protein CcmH
MKLLIAKSFTLLLSALIILGFTLALESAASIQVYQFEDKQNELRFNKLVQELRCPKCQNNNLADSNSALSIDLKNIIYEKIHAGESDQAIVSYLKQRYGDFISYRPPVTPATWFIWFGPFILLAAGCFAVFRFLSKPQRAKPQAPQVATSAKSHDLLAEWSKENQSNEVESDSAHAPHSSPESKD